MDDDLETFLGGICPARGDVFLEESFAKIPQRLLVSSLCILYPFLNALLQVILEFFGVQECVFGHRVRVVGRDALACHKEHTADARDK